MSLDTSLIRDWKERLAPKMVGEVSGVTKINASPSGLEIVLDQDGPEIQQNIMDALERFGADNIPYTTKLDIRYRCVSIR